MPTAAWLEIPDFAVRFAAACLSGTFKYLFLIILLIRAKYGMLIATVPFSDRRSFYFSMCLPRSASLLRRSPGTTVTKTIVVTTAATTSESGSA